MHLISNASKARALCRVSFSQPFQLCTTWSMEKHPKQGQAQPKPDSLKPEVSPEAQKQQQEGGVPPAQPTGTLQDVDPNELLTKRNQVCRPSISLFHGVCSSQACQKQQGSLPGQTWLSRKCCF